MTDYFPVAMEAVAKWEGFYSNDPDDRGGETKYGISQRAYPDLDIASITRAEATALYRRDYYDACRCADMPGWLAIAVFDCAVNQGASRSARWLQRALRVPSDGIIGPITLKAAQRASEGHLRDFMARRAMHYAQLNEKYHRGWYRRLFDIHRASLDAR